VYEAGLYNLTREQAPCLVHTGADGTRQWLLVRLAQPGQGQGGSGSWNSLDDHALGRT
jgi:hypothetical protein